VHNWLQKEKLTVLWNMNKAGSSSLALYRVGIPYVQL
jgi:hypothetical protein